MQFNGMNSSLQTVTCGGQQGPTLGPEMFLLHNNICDVSNTLDFKPYADDTSTLTNMKILIRCVRLSVLNWIN